MYIADLHIHSSYSRATSKDCRPETLDLWARKKGIHLVGTGDFTHPAWREELKEKLEPAEDGLYVLKEEYRIHDPAVEGAEIPRFVITGEISSIYKKGEKVRKVHSLIILPGMEEAENIACRLEAIGNIHSDGRPILGIPCKDLLEIVLEAAPDGIYVPAHIWTPHFSLFGAFSGFDTIEECFEDMTPYIHAVETGLSSDPPMNWRVSALDRFQLISNSDAHSPAKLGREANLLDIELSYQGLYKAVQEGKGLRGTIEFFPEEGKYHMDGHRKCGICLTPEETNKFGGICPVCGKKITIGVSHRVEELADRQEGFIPDGAAGFESLVPLPEVIGSAYGCSASSKKVTREYENMLQHLGPEFEVLRTVPIEDIMKVSGHRLAEGISRLREGRAEKIPGFDGEYGTIRLFRPEEIHETEGQLDFFSLLGNQEGRSCQEKRKKELLDIDEVKEPENRSQTQHVGQDEQKNDPQRMQLNQQQLRAVQCVGRSIAVFAGPGTGKTKTLIARILYLIEHRKIKASDIMAVTFTNQAAKEMTDRLGVALGGKRRLAKIQIGTFHALCLAFLKEQGREVMLATQMEQAEMAEYALQESRLAMKPEEFLDQLSRQKAGMEGPFTDKEEEIWEKAVQKYEEEKEKNGLMDFDDLLLETLQILEENERGKTCKIPSYILVDEFQDINPLQYRLLMAWNKGAKELFVIGDADQSIYGFRGASAACFEQLKGDLSHLEVVELIENYRSSPQILRAAETVLRRRISLEKGESGVGETDVENSLLPRLHPNCPNQGPVRLYRAGNKMGEAIFIAKEIGRMTGGIGMLEAQNLSGREYDRKIRSFNDIAVLCRTHRQAALIEKCFRQEGIPFVTAGRESFLLEEKVQGSLCFFRCLENADDMSARKKSAKILWKLSWNPVTEQILDEQIQRYQLLYRKKKPLDFLKIWSKDMQLEENEAIKKLVSSAVFHQSMSDFLLAVELGVESDLKRCKDKNYLAEAVTIMTLHGSKGLEFPVVMIYGVEKGSIPLETSKYLSDIGEEKRLLYVGMTRAKEELILTSSGEESPFLTGMEEPVIQREQGKAHGREESYHQMSLFE